jgi:purine-binding chemotaxis protein CheW
MSTAAAMPALAAGQAGATRGVIGAAAAGIAELSQFISFAIGTDQYGVDIMAVREIKGWSEITHLPKQPEYMRGVLNLRGAMVPIIDLRCRFGQGLTAATPLHVVIVVQIGARQAGLLADRVLDIVGVNAAQIQPVPRISPELARRLPVRAGHGRERHDRIDRAVPPAVDERRPGRRRGVGLRRAPQQP